jgi:hypothetical protein
MALVLALNPFSDFKCSTSPQADTVIALFKIAY